MAGYAASNLNATTPAQQNLSSSYKTLLNISSSATVRRIKIHEFVFGTDGVPADNAISWDVSRTTAVGTGTSGVIVALDPADGAALSVSTINNTAEPTVTANTSLWAAGMNQRATHRWVAYPGAELVVPATSAAGICFRAKSAGYTSTATAAAEFMEQ